MGPGRAVRGLASLKRGEAHAWQATLGESPRTISINPSGVFLES